jgi:hypothetical protein
VDELVVVLDLPSEDGVELLATCGDADDFFALVVEFHGGYEAGGRGLDEYREDD